MVAEASVAGLAGLGRERRDGDVSIMWEPGSGGPRKYVSATSTHAPHTGILSLAIETWSHMKSGACISLLMTG